jgi:LysM repeat protein
VVVSTINATNGSQPLPQAEVVLQIGEIEKIVKSDATGRFAPIIHPANNTAVHVKVTDVKTGLSVKIGTIEGNVGKDFNLVSKSQKWKGIAGSEKINSGTTTGKIPTTHVVQPGDNLWKIAKLHRTSANAIMIVNGRSDEKIYPGEVLAIGGKEGKNPVFENTPKKSIPTTASSTGSAVPNKKPRPVAPPNPPAPSSVRPSDSVRSKEGTGKILALINPSPGRAPWMHIAIAEAKLRGGETELTLQDKINYHEEVDSGFKALYGSSNAWCAAFVNWCLLQAKYPIDNPSYPGHRIAKARAHGFYEVNGPKEKKKSTPAMIRNPLFVELEKPIYGAIAMVTSGSHHGSHVGFVYAKSGLQDLILLGGNQNQRINFAPFKIALFASYTEKGKDGKIKNHQGSRSYLKYFVPISYYEHAKKDLSNDGLEEMDSDKLNSMMGIKNEKPKNSTTSTT